MDVKDRIEKVKEYFKGMQVFQTDNGNIIYVVIQFPNKWIIDDEITNKFGVSVAKGNDYPGQFYFCVEMEKGFDVVFDSIEYTINKMLAAQERALLFKKKTEELQNLFMDESIPLESLRGLEFNFKVPKTKRTPTKRVTPPKNEEVPLNEKYDENNESEETGEVNYE